MLEFYNIFPETKNLSLHLTSESYGGEPKSRLSHVICQHPSHDPTTGKYVPEIAAAVAKHNDGATSASEKIPLTTLAIGNQWFAFRLCA